MNDLHEDLEVIDDVDTAAKATPAGADIALGVTRGLTNREYHADRSAVSATQLKRMLISPAHFLAGLSEPEESTEAMLFGTVLHARLLEPDTFDVAFFPMPKVNRATKVGKAQHAEYLAQAAGRTVFPQDWLANIERIVDNARLHRRAWAILANGEPEVALSWIDPATGIKLKARIDWVADGFEQLADVKSALDVTPFGFGSACARLHYPLSAFMQGEAARVAADTEPRFAFIACEKETPNTVAVYRAGDEFLQRGEATFRIALRRLAECRERGIFPMMQGDGEWEDVALPGWY